MNAKRFAIRMKKEIEMFITQPPHGISCCPKENSTDLFDAIILGPEGTPYEGGIFHLALQLPDNYPFYPPRVRFLTRIYHPNIDESGRICLDILKNPPAGSWGCANSISTVLLAIQSLLSAPNPGDPLNPDVAELYYTNKDLYDKRAREYTEKHAKSLEPSSNLSASELFPVEDESTDQVNIADLEAPGPSGSKFPSSSHRGKGSTFKKSSSPRPTLFAENNEVPSPKPCKKEPDMIKEKKASTISKAVELSSSDCQDQNALVQQDPKESTSSSVLDVEKLGEGLSVTKIGSEETPEQSHLAKDSKKSPHLSEKEVTSGSLENGSSSVTNDSSNKKLTVSSSLLKRGGENFPQVEDLPLKKTKF